MNAAFTPTLVQSKLRYDGWGASLLLYCAFALVVYFVQGSQPLLGSDHLSYIQMADSIVSACPAGDYWRELNSVRTYGVILAYLHSWTGSYVVSMKVALAISTVLYLLAAQLFFGLFATRPQAILFAILSAFAVSFGIASWGVTDSTALLPRTLAAPVVMLAMWLWMRFHDGLAKYLAFPLLIAGSLLHLGAFYLIGVLCLMEIWHLWSGGAAGRSLRATAGFLASLALSGGLLLGLEYAAISSKLLSIHAPHMLRSVGIYVPSWDTKPFATCAKAKEKARGSMDGLPALRLLGALVPAAHAASANRPAAPAPRPEPEPALSPLDEDVDAHGKDFVAGSAREAWAIELSLRPWRNMPLPVVNVANALSSSALILALGLVGLFVARRRGFTAADRVMATMFVAVPLFAVGPQTLLWILRSFTSVYPATIEEVRAISLVVIPALYFILRLYRHVVEGSAPHRRMKAAGIIAGVLFLPLMMKSLPAWAREGILEAMTHLGVVDPARPSSVVNARSALGLSAVASLYYSTEGVRAWLETNTPPRSRILSTRDDMILVRDRVVVGPRQAIATTFYTTPRQAETFLRINGTFAARDTEAVLELARDFNADFVVVPWAADGALYRDAQFSVLAVRGARAETRR